MLMSSEIRSFNLELIKTIYKGVIDKKSFFKIHKELVLLTRNTKYNRNYYDLSLKTASTIARQLTREIKRKKIEIDVIPLFAFNLFLANAVYEQLSKCVFTTTLKFEAFEKKKILKESYDLAITKPKDEYRANIFYLSSKHGDCAKDHLDYQGKLYIDKRWKKIIKEKYVVDEIQKFIDKNKILFFQDIIDKPVYLFTRPNCRHFYKQLSVKEALDNSIIDLLTDNDMISTYGSDEIKTFSHSSAKDWYSRQNIEFMISKYKNRLMFNQCLYDVHKLDKLYSFIQKDKLLIEKWEKYLQKFK